MLRTRKINLAPSRPLSRAATLLMLAAGAAAGLVVDSGSVPGKAQGVRYIVTGSGHFRLTNFVQDPEGELRNFAFSAIKDADGDVHGQAQLNNRDIPVKDHVEVTCVNVYHDTVNGLPAKVAVIGGHITKSESKASPAPIGFPFDVGTPVSFAVVDNGEGKDAPPDLMTLEFPQGPPPDQGGPEATCTVPPGPFYQVEKGNVQIRVK